MRKLERIVFFARTVNTATAIPHLLSMILKDVPDPVDSACDTAKNCPSMATPDVQIMVALERGLEAHPLIVHGGFQCVLIDEITRFLILVHQNKISDSGLRPIHYTVSMSTKYFAPVRTPGIVLLRSKLVEKRGRKWTVAADIVDATGDVLTSAESIWVTARSTEAPGVHNPTRSVGSEKSPSEKSGEGCIAEVAVTPICH